MDKADVSTFVTHKRHEDNLELQLAPLYRPRKSGQSAKETESSRRRGDRRSFRRRKRAGKRGEARIAQLCAWRAITLM